MSELRDAFVRAVNDDGTIQIGHADPALEYGNRPVEIITITPRVATILGQQLFGALYESHEKLRSRVVAVLEPPES